MTVKLAALPHEKRQGVDMNIVKYVNNVYKTIEVPNTIKGCYGEYEGVGDCIACDLRLGCARMSAGGDNE